MKAGIGSILFFTLVLYNCSYGQTAAKKTDAEVDGFRDKVKEVKQDCYKVEQQSENIVLKERYNPHGEYWLKLYDSKGNKIKWNGYNKVNDSLAFYITIEHNENGILKATTCYPNGKVITWYEYKYAKNSALVTEIYKYKSDSSIEKRTTWKYDDKGNNIESTDYKPGGELLTRSTFESDEKGNETECTMYADDGNISWVYKWEYDASGNKTKESIYDFGGKFLNSKKIFVYDDKGNITEEKDYNATESLKSTIDYKYDLDTQGNWVRKTEFDDNTPVFITLREITYY